MGAKKDIPITAKTMKKLRLLTMRRDANPAAMTDAEQALWDATFLLLSATAKLEAENRLLARRIAALQDRMREDDAEPNRHE